jgi:galactokinase
MKNREIITQVTEAYQEKFNDAFLLVRSPGRVNIIGEHTDYNDGFVLPAAIDKAAYAAIGKRADNEIHLYSTAFHEELTFDISNVHPAKQEWANYVLGVVDQFQKNGYQPGGFNMVIDGDVPIGAGLSSSAAVECATGLALKETFGFEIDNRKMARMAQMAEHTFAGVKCGIMDMFASIFGKKDHLIKLDCRSLDFEYVPIAMQGIRIVLMNTNVKHSLASSEYNTRRAQCEEGVSLVKKKYPEVNSLRDTTMQMLDECIRNVDEVVYRRCKYVVQENERLLTGCEDLERNDIVSLGEKIFRSHEGLSKEYEVSCKELDYLVEQVKGNKNVLGARMMGGGFGGCTINLVKEEAIDELVAKVKVNYERDMKLPLTVYIAEIEDGSSVVT